MKTPEIIKRGIKTVILLVLPAVGYMQTPRLCLYEVFTGETCPPTATSNLFLNPLLAQPANAAKMVAIAWEVPIPSVPQPTWSLYKTNKTEIDWRYKSTAAGGYGYTSQWTSSTYPSQGINISPYGLIDGQQPWVFGAASAHPSNMTSTIISTAQSYTSAFSVTMAKQWNSNLTAVDLTISIVASANFTATGPLKFRTVMIERNVDFTVQPGTNGEKHFENVGIKSFPTLQGGISMVGTWTVGQSQTFTLNCPLPSYVRDKAQVGFVGFIQDDGNRKVAQAVMSKPEPFENDIKVISVLGTGLNCQDTAYTPTIKVKNYGSTPITSFTITPVFNGTTTANTVWNGNLMPGDTISMSLGTYSTSPLITGSNTLICTITNVSGGDNNTINNTGTITFNVGFPIVTFSQNPANICAGETATLLVQGGTSYSWSGFGYSNSIIVIPPVTTAYYVSVTNNTLNCTKTHMYTMLVDECAGLRKLADSYDLRVYPVPATDVLNIQFENFQHSSTYELIDAAGNKILSGTIEGKSTEINVQALQNGLYYVRVGTQVRKFIK